MRRFVQLVLMPAIAAMLCGMAPSVSAQETRQAEEERLALLKDRKVEALVQRLASARDEERYYVLSDLASVATPRAVEIVGQNFETVDNRGMLVSWLVSSGMPSVAPLLLQLNARGYWVIDSLAYVMGRDAIPHLHRYLDEADYEPARRIIRQKLVRLKDAQAITDLRRELAKYSSGVGSAQDARRAIDLLLDAVQGHCVECARDTGRLFASVDWTKSESHRQLVQFAADAALGLGDRASTEYAIELLRDPGSAYLLRDVGWRSIEEDLQRYTKQDFVRYEDWTTWWQTCGKNLELFSERIDPQDEVAIVGAVVEWARSAESGTAFGQDVAYVMDNQKYIDGRWRHWAALGDSIRVYTREEIGLLGVPLFGVTNIESDGQTAFARFTDGRNRLMHGHGPQWEAVLSKAQGRWRVTRATMISGGPPNPSRRRPQPCL